MSAAKVFVACSQPGHRPTDWVAENGKRHCSVCHPPAEGVVWVPADPAAGQVTTVDAVRPIINRARCAITAAANAPSAGLRSIELGQLRSACADVILEIRVGQHDRARAKAVELIAELEQVAGELDGPAALNMRAAIDALGEVAR